MSVHLVTNVQKERPQLGQGPCSVEFRHSVMSDSVTTPGFPVHHQLPELAQTHVHLW